MENMKGDWLNLIVVEAEAEKLKLKLKEANSRKYLQVVLFSGGIDSILTALKLYKNIISTKDSSIHEDSPLLVYIPVGHDGEQRYIEKFEDWFKRKLMIVKSTIIHTPQLPINRILVDVVSTYIPYRNLLFALWVEAYVGQVLGYCKDEKVDIELYIGGMRDDNVSDKTPGAFELMSKCMTRLAGNKYEIVVKSLFFDKNKVDAMKDAVEEYGKDYMTMIYKISNSCYKKFPQSQCGDCPACFRKWIALEVIGIESRGWFDKDPVIADTTIIYAKRIKRTMLKILRECNELGEIKAQPQMEPKRMADTFEILLKYGVYGE